MKYANKKAIFIYVVFLLTISTIAQAQKLYICKFSLWEGDSEANIDFIW